MYDDTIKSIAEIVYAMFKDSHISLSPKKCKWLTFDGLKWCFDEVGPQNKLSTDVVQYYQSLDEDANNIILKLKHSSYKSAIMKCCQHMFYDRGKLSRLDECTHLLCFRNGILDTRCNTFLDRGKPEWLITIWIDENYFEAHTDDEIEDLMILRDNIKQKRKVYNDATCNSLNTAFSSNI